MKLDNIMKEIIEKNDEEIKDFYLDLYTKLTFDDDEIISLYVNLIESGKTKEELIDMINYDYLQRLKQTEKDYKHVSEYQNIGDSYMEFLPDKKYYEKLTLNYLAVNIADSIVKGQKKLKNTI